MIWGGIAGSKAASAAMVAGSGSSNNAILAASFPGIALAGAAGVGGGGGGKTYVIVLQGNNTGVYAAPGLTLSNTLLCGFSVQDDLGSTAFNFSPSSHLLASDQVNAANGWFAGNAEIVDPTAADWSDFSLVWFYQ